MTHSPPKEHNFDAIPTVHCARRVLPPQVRRGRHETGEVRKVDDGRGDPGRAGGQRRQAHPHAVAVVLADRAGPRPADHRLRRHLRPAAHRRRRRASCCWRCSVGRSSRRSPTTADYDPPPQGGEPTKELRPLADIAHRYSRRPTSIRPHDHPVDDHHGDDHGGHARHARPGSATTSWRCGCSSAASACCSAASSPPTCCTAAGTPAPRTGPGVRHPVHLGQLFVLLMSSLTMVLAVSAAQRRDDRSTDAVAHVTALLGATFVGGQVYEFTTFYHEGLGFTTSLFGSASTPSPASTACTSPSASSC